MADDPSPNTCKDHVFGTLNDVTKPHIRKRYPLDSGAAVKAMAQAAAAIYTPNALANVGQFKAIVLRVEEQPTIPEPGNWVGAFFGDEGFDGGAGQRPSLVEIKARVPEIHSMLPIPEQLGSGKGPHQKIIDMYPTFIAMTFAVEAPKPGDLVWVDWGNRQNWTDPVYVRPVMETRGGGTGGETSGNAFANCSGNSYSAKPSSGDSTAGQNKPVKPFTGLPRLNRKKKVGGKPTYTYDANVDPAAKKEWEAAAKELPPGVTILVPLKSNGRDDKKHKHGKRSTLIWYSNNTDFEQDWELIYWFHGLTGFSKKNFIDRIVPQLKTMTDHGRNFVFVKPELPWSNRGTKKKRGPRQSGAWDKSRADTWGGDFAQFHAEVMGLLETGKTQPAFISCYGHSNGGSALARAAEEGAFNDVKPNRIFFSDSDYKWGYQHGGAVGTVWEKYVKNDPNVWLTALTINNKPPRKFAKKFFAAHAAELKGRPVYHIQTKKSHKWCGHNALSVVADEHRKRQEEAEKKKKAEAVKAKPDSEEKEENEAVADQIQKAKDEQANEPVPTPAVTPETPSAETPVRDPAGKPPPAQEPAASPSKVSKQSETSKNPTWKTEPAKPYAPLRVKLADYGGALVGAAAEKLLEEVEPGKKLHVLVAKRYKSLKAAAVAAGFSGFKLASAWRKHKWRDRAHYTQYCKDWEAKKRAKGDNKVCGDYIAFNSPHESGMAFDLGAHGLSPNSNNIPSQSKTKLFKWLKENAHKHGFTPYKKEPWHWECRLPYDSYASGEEFTEDYATRVADIGGKHAQLPTGPGSGTGAQGGGQRCVRTGGGGGRSGGPPGPYNPGPAYAVPAGGSMSGRIVGCNPPKDASEWGIGAADGKLRWVKKVDAFVLHEVAGWQKTAGSMAKFMPNRRGATRAVHYWGGATGKIMQMCDPRVLCYHAAPVNSHSCGIEVATWCMVTSSKVKKLLGMGYHIISEDGRGDIPVFAGKTIAGTYSKNFVMPTHQQFKAAWDLIVSLAKSPPPLPAAERRYGTKGRPYEGAAPTIDLKITFPCVPDRNKFFWSKWNGKPSMNRADARAWFEQHQPTGIYAHARMETHHDGLNLEYYCLGRAQGLGHLSAFYAVVGAQCSGIKHGQYQSTGPPAAYVALGKQKYPAAWLKGKTYYVLGKKKFKEQAAAHPEWFAEGVSPMQKA